MPVTSISLCQMDNNYARWFYAAAQLVPQFFSFVVTVVALIEW